MITASEELPEKQFVLYRFPATILALSYSTQKADVEDGAQGVELLIGMKTLRRARTIHGFRILLPDEVGLILMLIDSKRLSWDGETEVIVTITDERHDG